MGVKIKKIKTLALAALFTMIPINAGNAQEKIKARGEERKEENIKERAEERKCLDKEKALDIFEKYKLDNLKAYVEDENFCLHASLPFSFKKGEKEKDYAIYREEMGIEEKIRIAKFLLNKYKKLLNQAEKYYGVDKEMIASIISVESAGGNNVGRYRLINALVSMYYHSLTRKAFWANELATLNNNIHIIDPLMPSSPAGAFGISQFLPSSYIKYGLDFDKDGKIDLFSWPDAIGSVARYLYAHGYKKDKEKAIYSYNPYCNYVKLVMEIFSTLKNEDKNGEINSCK